MRQRVNLERRRRVAVRVAFLVLGGAMAIASVTACVFEQSDYKGGGRLGRAVAVQQDEGQEPPPAGSSGSSGASGTSGVVDSGPKPTPIPDAGVPGS